MVNRTIFRKLEQLDYCTSYSHRGKYYALKKNVYFEKQGLWSYQNIWFSKYGTLVITAEELVNKSEAGYFVQELDNILHTNTKKPLLNLIHAQRLVREKYQVYIYTALQIIQNVGNN